VTQDQFTQVSKKVSDIPAEDFTINIELFIQTFTNVELVRQNWIVSKATSPGREARFSDLLSDALPLRHTLFLRSMYRHWAIQMAQKDSELRYIFNAICITEIKQHDSETPALYSFVTFYLIFHLNQDFMAKLQCLISFPYRLRLTIKILQIFPSRKIWQIFGQIL
jgi:hypothetical protein